MGRPRGSRSVLVAQWRERLLRWQASGDSVAAFCRREQVHAISFYKWRRRFADSSPAETDKQIAPKFLKVEVVPDRRAVPSTTMTCELFVGSLVCRLPIDAEEASVRRWLRLLREEATPC